MDKHTEIIFNLFIILYEIDNELSETDKKIIEALKTAAKAKYNKKTKNWEL